MTDCGFANHSSNNNIDDDDLWLDRPQSWMTAQQQQQPNDDYPLLADSSVSIVSGGEGHWSDTARLGVSDNLLPPVYHNNNNNNSIYGGYQRYDNVDTMPAAARVSEPASLGVADPYRQGAPDGQDNDADDDDPSVHSQPQETVVPVVSDGKHLRMQALREQQQQQQQEQQVNNDNEDDDDTGYESEPTEYNNVDVLLGRGGLTNRHPGNQAYLVKKKEMQPRYMNASKQEKTVISRELVEWVHQRGGRFLQRQNDQWVEVNDQLARRKASQALREVNDSESRARKRARYRKK